MAGLLGSVFYFLGIPFTLHFWYFRKVFPEDINYEIGDMFIPDGVESHPLFIIFLTLRWMLISIILSFVPITWGLQRPLIIALITANILLVMYIHPYEKYYPRQPLDLDHIELKWFNRLCATMSGNFLDILTLCSILLSYTALDHRDNWIVLQVKSFVIGLGNLAIVIYIIFFILLEDRLTLFPKISKVLARLEVLLCTCCYLCYVPPVDYSEVDQQKEKAEMANEETEFALEF